MAIKLIIVISIALWTRCYAIGYNAAFSLSNASFAGYVVEYKVNMSLIADSCRESLKLGTSSRFLLSKADRV